MIDHVKNLCSWLSSNKSEISRNCNTLKDMDHHRTETRINFLECLDPDVCLYIMSFLDDPADVVRAGAVSHTWRQFVIANGLVKQLCLKQFPKLSDITGVVDASEGTTSSVEAKTGTATKWETFRRDHMVYASLFQEITKSSSPPMDCIANAISASSTDNFPDESIVNTLTPMESLARRPLYWSSKGQSNPELPEMLVYKLRSGCWVLTEIDIQPFEAFFQHGSPIYSAKSVRFKMGHPKSTEIRSELRHLPLQKHADDMFVWTYTSPEFPMTQENRLQRFQLPEPVLCIGGFLQIELLGRVQKQEFDDLFYICVRYVRVLGRSLYPAFDMEVLHPSEKILLKYFPEHLRALLQNSSGNQAPHLLHPEDKMIGLMFALPGIQHGFENPFEWDEDDDDEINGDPPREIY